ncbi:uncharacterized protein TRIADDRAFT_51692 [Trichoplax adhaerens]|uniref:Uncharacterized protein n=1 Tax=Trichoplax adhaerens TaxID=10228 RepID=B3RKI4_TRIAD|nr:predicted protein [Trichoplax adhaerens]EDV29408.1 predicted protein [Trichoplax adhaerens]|eukprot:XP_002108610.1 predicted protein [Trichoplax adhaerens]
MMQEDWIHQETPQLLLARGKLKISDGHTIDPPTISTNNRQIPSLDSLPLRSTFNTNKNTSDVDVTDVSTPQRIKLVYQQLEPDVSAKRSEKYFVNLIQCYNFVFYDLSHSFTSDTYSIIHEQITKEEITSDTVEEIADKIIDEVINEVIMLDCSHVIADELKLTRKERDTVLYQTQERLADHVMLDVLLDQMFSCSGKDIVFRLASERVIEDIMLSVLLYQHNAIEDSCEPTKSNSIMYGLLKDAAQEILKKTLIELLSAHMKEDMKMRMIEESEEQFKNYLSSLSASQ